MTMKETWSHMKIIVLLHWFGVFLSFSGQNQAEHSQYHNSPEVVIPLKLSGTSRGMNAPGWLSYSLNIGGQSHIIHIKVKKGLLSRHMSVFTYTEQGVLLEDQPFIQNDCYYHGYVEGNLKSMVALSSCFGGFRGMLQINDIAYEIKPLMFSPTSEHLVYKIDNNETQFPSMTYGFMQEEIAHQLEFRDMSNFILEQSAYEDWWTHVWYVTYAVVVDHTLYLHYERNVSKLQEDIYDIVNIVDSIYDALGVNVLLFGIEIWTHKNFFSVDNIKNTLTQFCQWKVINLSPRLPHNIIHLYTNKGLRGLPGLAYLGGVCKMNYNCGIVSFLNVTLNKFAIYVAHELGHVLGMDHDTDMCTCGQNSCLMNSRKIPSTSFSNCSYASWWKTTIIHGKCMRDNPQTGNILIGKRCGNGVVEEEEECDCGSFKYCANDPCCLENCMLSPGALCAFGLCCKDCMFLPPGELCRQKVNECDLPEWCTGKSHQCPQDLYVQDGISCSEDGYCYEKRCNDRNEQCRKIFGKESKSANQICYKEINTRGDRFGHCGINGSTYVKCAISDILCGRVQCENVIQIPTLRDHTTIHFTKFNSVSCWGTDYHFGMTIPDIGEVKDGTDCGPGNICIHRQCVEMSSLKRGCSAEICSMRGICNNKHQCHCYPGWAPPNCVRKGNGGSIDSGIPPEGSEGKISRLLLLPILLFPFISICVFFCCKKSKEEQQNVQTQPQQGEQKVETQPQQGEQKVETQPPQGEQKVETQPPQGKQKS
ncbi:disintegrin and metalloproteinase domain-containing protein 29 [Orycteropus afer afer]|uniref:Disintegrin and metalloproteinase domain-containing protein 29 n=1 Tax=Orycteropus afer afer TaxID=1230840 RepID=A0A8B7AL45_ORYAF|nr:disintegrin and metalloproteinase domain-containing protein 29 [Orycteropus afer afer]